MRNLIVRNETSRAEIAFWLEWGKAAEANPSLPVIIREHRFHAIREWRFDFAWQLTTVCPPQSPIARSRFVALEIEGRGRHQTIDGYRKDCEKYNEATRMGWEVYRFPATDWKEAAQWVEFMVETMFYGR